MSGDVIKQYLVGLGFEIDESSFAAFSKGLQTAAIRVAALYGTIKVAAAGIAYAISKVSEGFEQMGVELRLITPMFNKFIITRQEMARAYAATGLNIRQTVQQAVLLNLSLAKTKIVFEAIYKSAAARFFPLLTKQSDLFRQKLYDNMPKIVNGIQKFVQIVFEAFEWTVQFGERLWSVLGSVYDLFVALDRATDGWSTKILAALAAWKYLDLGFVKSHPILTLIVSALTALFLLWDDFKTFQEGGNSLINWGSDTTKTILGVAAAIGATVAAVYAAIKAYQAWQFAAMALKVAQVVLNFALAASPLGWVIAALTAIVGLVVLIVKYWDQIKGFFVSSFGLVGGKILDFFGGNGGKNAASNIGNGVIPGVNPVGSSAINNNSNQQMVLHQQNNIGITGVAVADANGYAQAVGQVMNRSNQDMVRNLKGSVSPALPTTGIA